MSVVVNCTGRHQVHTKLLIVIVNYRVAHLAIDCLYSLAEQIGQSPGARVAVCENGTGDDSVERIQKVIDDNGWGAWCSLTAVNPNLGFTGGNNVILRLAMQSSDPPDYFLLLNTDTIVRPNALNTLLMFMEENPNVGIAGSRLEEPDGTPQRSAFRFQSPASEFEAGLKLGFVTRLLNRWVVAPPVRDDVHKTDWVSGACMMIRREVFRDVGLLDEDYFTYFDDCDFCFNAHRSGWSTWYVPAARVVHLKGQSTGVTKKKKSRIPSYYLEARRRYFLKNYSSVYAALSDAALILGLFGFRARVLLTGKEDSLAPNLLWDTIQHSVFMAGFRLNKVANPALAGKS